MIDEMHQEYSFEHDTHKDTISKKNWEKSRDWGIGRNQGIGEKLLLYGYRNLLLQTKENINISRTFLEQSDYSVSLGILR